jgi:hypothetical protein
VTTGVPPGSLKHEKRLHKNEQMQVELDSTFHSFMLLPVTICARVNINALHDIKIFCDKLVLCMLQAYNLAASMTSMMFIKLDLKCDLSLKVASFPGPLKNSFLKCKK